MSAQANRMGLDYRNWTAWSIVNCFEYVSAIVRAYNSNVIREIPGEHLQRGIERSCSQPHCRRLIVLPCFSRKANQVRKSSG